MTSWFTPSDEGAAMPRHSIAGIFRLAVAGLLVATCAGIGHARADAVARANAAYARGDFVQAVNLLTPLALRGNAGAQARLGFMFENGYGEPQVYVAAADLYCRAAIQGNAFGQAMLGLMYDKGHGVPQDFILAYKWLNLAAARAPTRERDYVLRLRNAVASKMSRAQIAEGQRLAMLWSVGLP
jgi:TPR repeat protein